MPSTKCHDSPFAGSWYPGEKAALEDLLNQSWEVSERKVSGPLPPGPLALVAPHAGIAYSGNVAAAAYRSLEQHRPRRILILGFTHRGSAPGVWIPDLDAYRTPMGETPLDGEAVAELLATGRFRTMAEDRLCDHSVEIQLPFIARAAPDAAVVPIYVAALSEEERKGAASVLASLAGPDSVVLASSDFTHYGDAFRYKPFPSDATLWERLCTLDSGYIDAASSLDAQLFLDALDAEAATVCGREPIALLMETLSRLPSAEDIFQLTLDYATSGEMTSDRSHSVSYAALGYFPWQSFLLDSGDGQRLLESARNTLRLYQDSGERRPVIAEGGSPALERPAAAFVTLRHSAELRGCVGRCAAAEPLSQVVPDMALAAALEDRRFEPLRRDERDVEIAVSVLSPMKRLASPELLRAGIDGGYLQSGVRSGLLLPEVASDRDWSTEQFLDALARKAGVSPDVYGQPDTLIHTFRAQVFR